MGLKAAFHRVVEFVTRVHATPSLDVAANREHLRSGEPERMRRGLGFLAEIGPGARDARPEIEALLTHEDPQIRELAQRAREAIDGV